MRDEKEISSQIESNADKLFGKNWRTKLAYSAGYMDGIAYADSHPNWEEIVERMRKEITNDLRNDRWISVEEELPKEHEWILGYSLKREYIDVYNFDSNGLIEAHGITHWMPLPSVEHLRETTKMIEKGGER